MSNFILQNFRSSFIKKTVLIFTVFLFCFAFIPVTHAQESQEGFNEFEIPVETFYKARIVEVVEQGQRQGLGENLNDYQILRLEILNGDEEGRGILLEHGGNYDLQESQKFESGQLVVLNKTQIVGDINYSVSEPYRLNNLLLVSIFFVLLVFAVARWQGISSFVGMIFSLLVIIWWVIPSIANGRSPFLVSFLATLIIAVVSLYLAHGFKKRTTVALFSILITVGFAILIGVLASKWLFLTGGGSEEAFSLQLFNLPNLDLRGLFLGGIVIGALGVLDDVTMAQAATVEELKKANASLDFKELYKRGMSVGREHITSLINTLVLAYAGVSFPLLILFYINDTLPFWMILNNEGMIEEIVRTLVGSSALLLAVPITTFLAARTFGRETV